MGSSRRSAAFSVRAFDAARDLRSTRNRNLHWWRAGPATRAYQMDFFERCFVALTVVGSLGVIAIVISMLMH